MQYLLLIYDDEKRWAKGYDENEMKEYAAFGQEFQKAIVGGKALQPTKTATTLRCEACKARTAEYSRRHYRKMKAKSRRMSEGDYVDGATFSQIGLALGISRSRVEQIYHRAIKKLWRECKRQGIDPGMIIGRGFSAIALCEKWADG